MWTSADGDLRGQAIEPLYKGAVRAAEEDPLLYKMLASIDIIRVGRNREVNLAVQEFKSAVLGEPVIKP